MVDQFAITLLLLVFGLLGLGILLIVFSVFFGIGACVGQLCSQGLMEQDRERPDVASESIVAFRSLLLNHLEGHVTHCAEYCGRLFAAQGFRGAKVNHLYRFLVFCYQDILWFDISMSRVIFVELEDGLSYLFEEHLRCFLGQVGHELLNVEGTQFQHQIVVFLVFVVSITLEDVLVDDSVLLGVEFDLIVDHLLSVGSIFQDLLLVQNFNGHSLLTLT